MAARIARIARRVAHDVVDGQAELKSTDQIAASTAVLSTAPLVTALTLVPGGFLYYEHVGLRTRLQSLRVSWRQQTNPASAASGNLMRFMVVVDRDQAGTGLIVNNLLGTALFNSSTPPLTTSLVSPLTLGSRYKILKDKVYSVSNGTSTRAVRRWSMRFRNRTVDYLDMGSSTSSHGPGFIYCLWISEDSADGPLIQVHARCNFFDT